MKLSRFIFGRLTPGLAAGRAGASAPRRSSAARLLVALAAVLAAAASADAGIVSVGSAISVLDEKNVSAAVGGGLASGELESSTSVRLWLERVVTLGSNVTTNHNGTAGTFDGSTNPLVGGTLLSGSRVASYFLHFDPSGSNRSLTNSGGSLSISFDQQIVGVFVLSAGVAGSDATFRPSDLTYSGTSRGYELGTDTANGTDRFSISADRMTLTILRVSTGSAGQLDQIRVITNPEPGTVALFALGVGGLAALLTRRRLAARRRRSKSPTAPRGRRA